MDRLRFTGDCDEATFEAAVAGESFWYQSFSFDNGFEVRGDYDVSKNIHEYGFPDDLSGMRVLDVGAASGWFSFYFEQLGAEVTAVDVRSFFDLDIFGRYTYAPDEAEHPLLSASRGPYGRGFKIMHRLLQSDVRIVDARVYELRPELFGDRTFDLVFMSAVLPHVRDPIGALRAARSVCNGKIIATTSILPGRTTARYAPTFTPESNHPWADMPHLSQEEPVTWWRPNRACFALWFAAAGFRAIDASQDVTLTADLERTKGYSGERANPTQVLALGHAHVEGETDVRLASRPPSRAARRGAHPTSGWRAAARRLARHARRRGQALRHRRSPVARRG